MMKGIVLIFLVLALVTVGAVFAEKTDLLITDTEGIVIISVVLLAVFFAYLIFLAINRKMSIVQKSISYRHIKRLINDVEHYDKPIGIDFSIAKSGSALKSKAVLFFLDENLTESIRICSGIREAYINNLFEDSVMRPFGSYIPETTEVRNLNKCKATDFKFDRELGCYGYELGGFSMYLNDVEYTKTFAKAIIELAKRSSEVTNKDKLHVEDIGNYYYVWVAFEDSNMI